MKINCVNLTLANRAILNLSKRKEKKELERPCVSMLQYSTKSAFTCSNLTVQTLEQGVKYVQS